MKSVLILLASLTASPSFAIPEVNYSHNYETQVIPFMNDHAQRFTFKSFDGLDLSAVHFSHPSSRGTLVILPGRSEPWLKYAEVFYDLYQQGYSIYAYDHRGQGLSPHLSSRNPQIGHVVRFQHYVNDLNSLMTQVVVPAKQNGEKLYLLAHSMGGAIATAYLEQFESPFEKAILSAPMLQLNTKPYPGPIAKVIVSAACRLGLGNRYAIGKTDYDLQSPFEKNDVTRSRARFDMTNEVYQKNPATLVGGPSNRWVYESLGAIRRIRSEGNRITTPVLLFQAGHDQLVLPSGQNSVCEAAISCHRIVFPESEHEILMERDSIRDHALELIRDFF